MWSSRLEVDPPLTVIYPLDKRGQILDGMAMARSFSSTSEKKKSFAHQWEGFLPKNSVMMTKTKKPKPDMEEPDLPPVTRKDSLSEISKELQGCLRCKLCKTRTHIVLGEGNPQASLVFVGEGPGEQEDLLARPFVGRAGQLLDKMIQAIQLSRSEVFIANVVKCRPPGNRNPEPDEIEACSPFLLRQLDVLKPKVIVALGKFASQTLLQTEERISLLRGRFHPFRQSLLMPTFHPSYLLRNPSAKKEAWEDLKMVAAELGISLSNSKI